MSSFQFLTLERLQEIFVTQSTGTFLAINLSIISATLALFVFYRNTRKPKVPLKRIPGPKVNGLISTIVPLISIFRNKSASNRALLFQVICGYSHVFRKEGMWLFGGGFKSILILYKAETVEPVLNSNEILSKGFEYDFLSPWLKEGLLTSKRVKWRYRRKLLTPAFHFRILDEFIPVFNEQAKVFAENIAKLTKNGEWIDIGPVTSLCTLDIICETAMGKIIKAQENSSSPYVQALHLTCRMAIERLLQPWLWPDFIYYLTSSGRKFRKCLNVMDEFTQQVVREKKEEKLKERAEQTFKMEESDDEDIGRKTRKRLALLDLLLDLHFKDPSFTLQDIAEEVDNFMFAGHDTTSSGLSWALYALGVYPEVQAKAYREIEDVLGDDINRPITLDDIKELKYLDCVLKETRRLWPPTPFIARELEEDTIIKDITIPKGTSCGILIHMLHRDPEVFPNPEAFDPDRFLMNNATGRHPFAYVPFSAGPRNCIGQRFATFEAITVMATIIRRFEISSAAALDKVQIVDELVMRSENGLWMTFRPRRPTVGQ